MCNRQEESSYHAIKDCDHAQCVWECAAPPIVWKDNDHAWVRENVLCYKESQNIEWATLFPFICYEIWKNRNLFIFEKQNVPQPLCTLRKAIYAARDFLTSYKIVNLEPTQPGNIIFNDPTCFYIHVDASFLAKSYLTGIAGVLRNHKGEWLGGFQKSIYAKDVLMAELLAILEGLRFAHKEYLNNITIISDNKQAITLMNMDYTSRDFYCHVVNECREWQKRFQTSQFVFVRREHNGVADEMAKDCRKNACMINETRDIPIMPSFCETLVELDCMRLFHSQD
ncbi:uncharacterized protein LOC125495487 [Beta vulgaris subsp. vulgaris]|uniref:uncharacterized protein LOC125495487 n=1 Tax=Beta vulgaris subsp. vulgaris TaxID=3555 RepID=UPI002036A4A6|nr:uncharacterized protein LOC125495487 [Beta vulgaris subsp. vulgaris]